jgi:tetratricopeptide (TPR) repeat protein
VVNFESPSAYFSDFVLEELQGRFIGGKRLRVTERSKVEFLRNELDFQMSGMVSDESAVGIGHLLGAQVIITGRFTDIGGAYRCRFNAIDIETAERQVSPAVTVRRDRIVAFMLPETPATVPARPAPALASAYFNSGFAHYEAQRYAEAIADFTRALEAKKNDEASLRYRAHSYYELKDYNRAIADYNEALRLNPNDARAYYNRGIAYDNKGDYDRAIADYNEALRLNPNDAGAYYNRGNFYYDKGDYDRAIADYTQAIRLNPDYAKAYNNRGVAYNDKRDYDRAIADYTQAIRSTPITPMRTTTGVLPITARGTMTGQSRT